MDGNSGASDAKRNIFCPKKKQDVFCRDSFMVSWKEYTLED